MTIRRELTVYAWVLSQLRGRAPSVLSGISAHPPGERAKPQRILVERQTGLTTSSRQVGPSLGQRKISHPTLHANRRRRIAPGEILRGRIGGGGRQKTTSRVASWRRLATSAAGIAADQELVSAAT